MARSRICRISSNEVAVFSRLSAKPSAMLSGRVKTNGFFSSRSFSLIESTRDFISGGSGAATIAAYATARSSAVHVRPN